MTTSAGTMSAAKSTSLRDSWSMTYVAKYCAAASMAPVASACTTKAPSRSRKARVRHATANCWRSECEGASTVSSGTGRVRRSIHQQPSIPTAMTAATPTPMTR